MDIFDEITKAIVVSSKWLGRKIHKIIDIMLFRE